MRDPRRGGPAVSGGRLVETKMLKKLPQTQHWPDCLPIGHIPTRRQSLRITRECLPIGTPGPGYG